MQDPTPSQSEGWNLSQCEIHARYVVTGGSKIVPPWSTTQPSRNQGLSQKRESIQPAPDAIRDIVSANPPLVLPARDANIPRPCEFELSLDT